MFRRRRDPERVPGTLSRRSIGTTPSPGGSGIDLRIAPKLGEPALDWNRTKERIRSHVFRIWTAFAVLAAYVYGWLYMPEVLTWWKRTTTSLIEAGCNLIPYPWGDRIEDTLGNFGLWVQITLAIIVFRILVWLLISAMRRIWSGRSGARANHFPAEDSR
jgi:hypothetical protein